MSDRKSNPALDALRHHVSGAVERGEAEPITEQTEPITEQTEPFDHEAECREFARVFPTPNVRKGIAYAEAGTISWAQLNLLFRRTAVKTISEQLFD